MIYNLKINNIDYINENEDFARALKRVQADPRAFNYLNPKRDTLLFFAANIDYRAAAFIKQELLSRGGDAAVAKHVIDGKTELSDILIIANYSQIFRLLEKLKAMDCWGLREFREELSRAFENIKIKKWDIKLLNGQILELSGKTKIMGIINLTPDSFYAESRVNFDNLIPRAADMINDGADIIDLGAESTRPDADAITCEDELNRLIPALKELKVNFKNIIISVDTYRWRTALEALNAGADIINDISGFNFNFNKFGENILKVIAETGAPYVLSHIEGTPATMRSFEGHNDILCELNLYFIKKLKIIENSGIDLNKIIIDPGLGFAKDANDNLAILKNIDGLKTLGRPVLIGHSRKRFVHGDIFETAAISALMAGKAQILRVHDVHENKKAVDAALAVQEAELWR